MNPPLLLLDSEPPPVLALLDLQVLISLASHIITSLPEALVLNALPTGLQVEHRVLVTTPTATTATTTATTTTTPATTTTATTTTIATREMRCGGGGVCWWVWGGGN